MRTRVRAANRPTKLYALTDVMRRAEIGSRAELIFLARNFNFPAPVRGRLDDGASGRWSRSAVDAWMNSDARARYWHWSRAA